LAQCVSILARVALIPLVGELTEQLTVLGSFASGAFVDVEIGRHGATLDSAIAVDCLMLEVATAHKA
jgi:hypothetical protein